METPTQRQAHYELVALIYPICRNHFRYKEAGIMEILESHGITNKSHLKAMTDEELLTLANKLVNAFKHKMLTNPSSYDRKHWYLYFEAVNNLNPYINKLDQ